MRLSSININFCKKPHLPKGNYNVVSLLTNRPIYIENVWGDLQKYVETQPNLKFRKLTKPERFIFVHLPNIEVKKMYLQKILSTIKNSVK